jgi:hypothetical protein
MDTETYRVFEWLLDNPLIFLALIIWTMAWKGWGLWRSATLRQKPWFVAILLLNTLGIIEIIYLFFVSRKYEVEVIEKEQAE